MFGHIQGSLSCAPTNPCLRRRSSLKLRTRTSGAVIVRAGTPASEACSAHSIMARVESVDEHYATAVAAGAKASGPPTTHPYGERQYGAQDLAGHWWVFSESVQDVHPSEWGGELVGPA